MSTESRTGRITRLARRVIYLFVLIGVMVFFLRYDIVTIPDDYTHLSTQRMSPGTHVVLTECDSDTVIGIGSVVIYEPPRHPDKRCWGVIAGLPGETITVQTRDDGMAILVLGDREELLLRTQGWELSSGVIPDGHFIILAGDRHLRVPSTFPDSRQLGPIARDQIQSKVVAPLSFF